MTSDAKIGLLLGLVFIFIIAFVINGLPRFRNATDSNEPAVVVQGDAIGERERNIEGVFEENIVEEQQAKSVLNEDDGTEYALYKTPWSDDYSVAQGNHVDEVPDSLNPSQETEQYSDYPPLAENINNTEEDLLVANNSQDLERYRIDLPTTVSEQSDISITPLSTNTQEQQRAFPPSRQGFQFQGGQNRSNFSWGQRRPHRDISVPCAYRASR